MFYQKTESICFFHHITTTRKKFCHCIKCILQRRRSQVELDTSFPISFSLAHGAIGVPGDLDGFPACLIQRVPAWALVRVRGLQPSVHCGWAAVHRALPGMQAGPAGLGTDPLRQPPVGEERRRYTRPPALWLLREQELFYTPVLLYLPYAQNHYIF